MQWARSAVPPCLGFPMKRKAWWLCSKDWNVWKCDILSSLLKPSHAVNALIAVVGDVEARIITVPQHSLEWNIKIVARLTSVVPLVHTFTHEPHRIHINPSVNTQFKAEAVYTQVISMSLDIQWNVKGNSHKPISMARPEQVKSGPTVWIVNLCNASA